MAYKSFLFNKFLLGNFYQHILRKAHSEVASVSNVTTRIKSKVKKAPFMKNVFLGIVDNDILYFPEIDTTEEDNAQNDTQLKLQTKAITNEEGSFQKLLRSGICRHGFPEIYGGLQTSFTHLLKEIEKLEISAPLSCLVESQYSFVIRNIVNYGSELQKKKYLTNLMSGTSIGTYALQEDDLGPDPTSIHCKATPGDFSETPSFILNGEKTRVINASNADLYIVIAQIEEINRQFIPGVLSAFIVDRDTPGITVSIQKKLTSEFDICHIKFDQAVVPQQSLLGNIGDGNQITVDGLESNKFIFALSILNLIRKLSSQVTTQICQAEGSSMPVRDYEFVQYRLSKIISTLYALESTIFLLAGMQDSYEMDTTLESVILQNLLFSYGFEAIYECINLFDNQCSEDLSIFKTDINNILLLSRSFYNPELLKFYVSLKAAQHVGLSVADTIMKNRNPLNYPAFAFKKMWDLRGQEIDSPRLNKKLYMNFHPSLKVQADQLEYSVYRLQYGLETFMTLYGKDAIHRQIDLVRLADSASDIFAMFAVLSRASRSYCTGIRFNDQEVLVANAWCQRAMHRVKTNIKDIIEGKMKDYPFLKLAPDIFQHKGYFFACPTEKNIH